MTGQISLKRLSAFVAIADKASAIMQSELKATRVKTLDLLSVESIAKVRYRTGQQWREY